MLKLGLIREYKTPPDRRVPFSPQQCLELQQNFPIDLRVQPSPIRCFSDSEYANLGIQMDDDMQHADVLFGVKEVPIEKLIPEKTYLFFSHTIKKQPYNRDLLRAILDKRIRMIDYEPLKNTKGQRVVAFGFYAGVVGAHNGIWAYGQRTNAFQLPRMNDCHDYEAVKAHYAKLELPALRIVVTGGGRVAKGAMRTLRDMGIRRVTPAAFLKKNFRKAVYTQLNAEDYTQHKAGKTFEKYHFYKNGQEYESAFEPYMGKTDIFINGIYYDTSAPQFFTQKDMQDANFRIKTIADITCDIAPEASVPSTLYASTIAEPVFGYNPQTGKAEAAYTDQVVDVMSIDNLPSELPRDASAFFGAKLIKKVIPAFLSSRRSRLLAEATVAENGKLGAHFQYLQDYVDGK